jgi:hypothetical protein
MDKPTKGSVCPDCDSRDVRVVEFLLVSPTKVFDRQECRGCRASWVRRWNALTLECDVRR